MSTQTLKDGAYRVIGYVETRADGTQVGKGLNYVVRGYYDPKTNKTRDANYRVVGEGNLLSSLITAGPVSVIENIVLTPYVGTLSINNLAVASTIANIVITSASANTDDSTFESGLNGWTTGGSAGSVDRDTYQNHTPGGAYGIHINTGLWDDGAQEYEYSGPGSISKTITTRAGTMTAWIYSDGYDSPVARMYSGGSYTQYNLTAGWHQYSRVVAGQTNDSIAIEYDGGAGVGRGSTGVIDDVSIPIP